MHTTDYAHSPLAAPANYTPPAWATEAINNASVSSSPILGRVKIVPGSEPVDGTSMDQGRIHVVAACRADSFCRCRRCKPPMSEIRDMQRSKRAALGIAGLFALYIVLQFVRAWIGGQL